MKYYIKYIQQCGGGHLKKIRFPVILFPFIVGVLVFFFLSPNINKENEQSVIITNEKIKKSPRASLEEGTPAPEFELSTLNGEKIKLADQTGKTVILNFWATWCPPCKEEMPHLKNFYVNNDREKLKLSPLI